MTTRRPETTPTIEAARKLYDPTAYYKTAAHRLRQARYESVETPAYTGSPAYGDVATLDDTVEGFTIQITTEYDDVDISWLGSFDDDNDSDAVSNYGADSRGHHYAASKFFHPEYPAADRATDWRNMGMARGAAWSLALEGVYSDRDMARQQTPLILIVTASVDGVELGRDVLGGVIFDDEYADDDEVVTYAIVENCMTSTAVALAQESAERIAKVVR